MAFRFFRRMKIAPGVSLNLSKSGGSLSFGPRGAKITAGTSGVRRTVGVPGTGMYWYDTIGNGQSRSRSRRASRSRQQARPEPTPHPEDQLDLGFFRRLFTPQGEEDFADGMRELVRGHDRQAFTYLYKASHLSDAAFMAGLLGLKLNRLREAEQCLSYARRKQASLGRYFRKYGIAASANVWITEYVATLIEPNRRGILLALAEVHQKQDRWRNALDCLKKLYQHDGQDIGVRLSLAELLVEDRGDKPACKQVIKLAEGVDNDSPLHAALLLYKGKALAKLGLHTAARDALTTAFRRKKDRPDDLLHEIQYQRALVYERLGRTKRARQELEKLYAADPDFEDVAQKLGV